MQATETRLVTKEQLNELGNKGELLGLMKARVTVITKIRDLEALLYANDNTETDRIILRLLINNIEEINTKINDLIKQVHNR